MNEARDVDDLSVLSRRGELTRREEQELDLALALAPGERFLHEAGRGFDLDATVLVEDDQLLERVKRQLESRRSGRPFLARWRFASGVAAGLSLAATAALGVELTRAFLLPTTAVPSSVPRQLDLARPAAPREKVASPLPGVTETPSDEAHRSTTLEGGKHQAKAAMSRAVASAPQASTTTAAPSAPPALADELFAAANRARSRGETGLAIALYQQLQGEYPGSAEAEASRLSLSMLQLKRAEPAAALEQLRLFRLGSPESMTAEALFGEAEAYRQLGRQTDERRALEELTARYPQSAYAVAAAKRLKQDH